MKWLSLRVGGQKIAVHVVRRAHPKLAGCDGTYHPEMCAVYLASDLEAGAREDALFHELDHVVNDISGATNALAAALSARPRAGLDALEEQLVRCRTPVWHRLLIDLGFRFPKGPKD